MYWYLIFPYTLTWKLLTYIFKQWYAHQKYFLDVICKLQMLFHVELWNMLSDSLTFSLQPVVLFCRAIKYQHFLNNWCCIIYFPELLSFFPCKGVLCNAWPFHLWKVNTATCYNQFWFSIYVKLVWFSLVKQRIVRQTIILFQL